MQKAAQNAKNKAMEGNTWQKFTNPKVSRGRTAFPSGQKLQQQLGNRYDYDGEITKDGKVFHKYNIQPNAGDIPSAFKQWREKNGGTHAVMSVMYVEKDGNKEDVDKALDEAHKKIKG